MIYPIEKMKESDLTRDYMAKGLDSDRVPRVARPVLITSGTIITMNNSVLVAFNLINN